MSLSSINLSSAMELLAKRDLFDQYAHRQKSSLSTNSFVYIFLWKNFFDFKFEVMESNLCIFAESETGSFLYLPPLGVRLSPKAIDKCYDRMEKTNNGNGVSRIENVDQTQLPFFSTEKFSVLLKSYDYCYYRENLVKLQGNPLKDKRNLCNAFTKNHKCTFLPYAADMKKACLALYEDWAKNRRETNDDPVFRHMLDDNRDVHETALTFYQELGLIGRVVKIDGEIKAYTFGYPVNEEMFCILFEIADLNFKGLSAYTFREFCDDKSVQPYKFINAMDDFAMPNLQRTKLSYQPVMMVPSYTVALKSSRRK